MRKSRINPNLSSHEKIFGIFNFNRTPFAPPGKKFWSITNLKREQHMILMDEMDGTLAEHRYTTNASNVTGQEPKMKELQKPSTYSLTILTHPKPPQNIHQELQHCN